MSPGGWRAGRTLLAAAAVAGLALAAVGFAVNREQFFFSYLTAFVFWVMVALGAIFFVLVNHLARAGWSVVVRRLAETAGAAMPVFLLLFLPLVAGLGVLYKWADPSVVARDPLLQHKAPFLNVPFFLIRAALYIGIWSLIARYFLRRSVAQDESGDPMTTVVLQRRAAPAVAVYAITVTLMSFDWLMSLTPRWYSTIFGVYVWSGGVLGALALLVLASVALRRGGYLTHTIRIDHFQDLGRLLFAFTVFWAYIAYSQYMLIWYGNLPEETSYFRPRIEGSWGHIGVLLILGHFFVPFAIFMSRWVKRRPVLVAAGALWVLLMEYLDVFWMSAPTLHPHGFTFSWIDAACVVGIGGVYLSVFAAMLARQALVPAGDPRLPESLAVEHAY